MDELRAGRASAEDIDDWIDCWHMADGIGRPLHVHLGLTWEEYRHWGATGRLPGYCEVCTLAYRGTCCPNGIARSPEEHQAVRVNVEAARAGRKTAVQELQELKDGTC
jgi:hypothetical protein